MSLNIFNHKALEGKIQSLFVTDRLIKFQLALPKLVCGLVYTDNTPQNKSGEHCQPNYKEFIHFSFKVDNFWRRSSISGFSMNLSKASLYTSLIDCFVSVLSASTALSISVWTLAIPILATLAHFKIVGLLIAWASRITSHIKSPTLSALILSKLVMVSFQKFWV